MRRAGDGTPYETVRFTCVGNAVPGVPFDSDMHREKRRDVGIAPYGFIRVYADFIHRRRISSCNDFIRKADFTCVGNAVPDVPFDRDMHREKRRDVGIAPYGFIRVYADFIHRRWISSYNDFIRKADFIQ